MTDITAPLPYNPARRDRIQRISDGVVASYIRDISVRRRRRRSGPSAAGYGETPRPSNPKEP
jgi:hypothetical protein